MNYNFALVPLVPLPLVLVLTGAALVLTIIALAARRRGALLRALAMALLLASLLNPQFLREQRERVPGVVALVIDETASQSIGNRRAETEEARKHIEAQLKQLPDIDVRTIRVGDTVNDETDGTELFRGLSEGLGDVPPEQVAGAIFITDGQVHDIPPDLSGLGLRAPLHALVTGRNNEIDRRIALLTAPRFGLVGHRQTFTFRIDDLGVPSGARLNVRVKVDGELVNRLSVRAGDVAHAEIEIVHAGDHIVEIEVDPLQGEVTSANNQVAVTVKGIRENLRVLLVSGEPHAGERTWRNLLKADAAVDLIHFTILRPPDKAIDATPFRELSLIAFPVRELFQEKINDFDLIIFDRYERRGILPLIYFENIARYVRNGGALLIASGPEDAGFDSLYQTPLAPILPAEPAGSLLERPFRATVSDDGKRHPVTRGLAGSASDPPKWSRWFRMLEAEKRSGRSLLQGPERRPLLILDRPEEGRVALFLSDQVWLWARGYEGGGPHVDLLRRLAHWLMKEPDLEEEALRAVRTGRDLVVTRQTLAETTPPANIISPTGNRTTLDLKNEQPGLYRGRSSVSEPGIYRIEQGDKTVLAHVGPLNPREFADGRSSTEPLTAIAEASGGSVRRFANASGYELPRVVAQRSGANYSGPGWIAIKASEASILKGIDAIALFNGLAGLGLLIGALGFAWYREGR